MSHFVYVFAASVCAGIALTFVLGAGLWVAGGLIVAAVLLLWAYLHTQKLLLLTLALACAAGAVGVVRADLFLGKQAQETIAAYVGQHVVLVGRVVADPDRRDKVLRLIVSADAVDTTPARGMALVLADRDTQVAYGDTVRVEAKVEIPEPFVTDTGHLFDYPSYLAVQGVSVQLPYASVEVVRPAGWSLQGALFALKHTFERSLGRLLPEPEGSLMAGILLGEKHGIQKELTDAFIASGLIHIVVLSGYNIAIVAEGVFRMLALLPRRVQFVVGGVLMLFFALMAGAGSATLRALLMALIALLARYYNRSALALRALMVALLALVLWNPYVLLHDPSFILSVLATFGLVTLSPWVERWLPQFLTKLPSVRSIAASTIAVQIFLLPALLYFSGVLSFLSVPANVLVLPFMPAVMLLGFVAGLLGVLSPILGFVPALLADVLLKWTVFVATAVAAVPFGTLIFPEFSGVVLCGVYVPLVWFAVTQYQKTASL